jgi:arsenite methyltransferase
MSLIPLSMQEESVRARYSEAARGVEAALCCPVSYDSRLLEVIPAEVLERDYGCGDPTPYVRPGDTVLDLGSGGGKLCYIAAQLAGPKGRVIGVDCNAEMLALARRHRDAVAQRLGYENVAFRCGLIQDLRLDLDLLAAELAQRPVRDQEGWLGLRSLEERLRRDRPMIADDSIDCVLSNCVLNLVRTADRIQLFAEIHRVLKPGGRAAVSDIVADEDIPDAMRNDPELWSGCVAGAFREDQFLQAFEAAGFIGIRLAKRERQPWRLVGGIAFRSVTVLAYKPAEVVRLGGTQALIYRGPFKKVEDDTGQEFARGRRTPVSDRTFQLLLKEPFAGLFEPVDTPEGIPSDAAPSCRVPDGSCC